jgi:tRNA pseudouridine55 synthase
LATGVLLLCLGLATRIVQYLSELDKTYLATFRLGVTTDTGDAQGRVIREQAVSATIRDIQSIVPAFIGVIQQTPPMFSAVKSGGRRLYKLARAGCVVERPSRTVRVYEIDVRRFEGTDLTLLIRCSKGTYIRSLADDLGGRLGCGAHVLHLQRVGVGSFTLDQALSLGEAEELCSKGCLSERMLSMNQALRHLPQITIDRKDQDHIEHGAALPLNRSALLPDLHTFREPIRLIGDGDRLLGLGRIVSDGSRSQIVVQPIRVFV